MPPVVYIVGTHKNHYKIGFVTTEENLPHRIRTLRYMVNKNLELIKAFPDEGYESECQLQLRFASRRVCGEWFALTDADLDLIINTQQLSELINDIPEEEREANCRWMRSIHPRGYDSQRSHEYRQRRKR